MWEAALLWRFVAENAVQRTGVRGLSPKARRDARRHSVRVLRCDSLSEESLERTRQIASVVKYKGASAAKAWRALLARQL